ncbi:Ark- serine/threonine protein kinase [Elasticomyces elasticus]|uniref:non-specific serine/threonine protein kinase n=1 Tax=Exophiala sideris TaxID=1016849 RepID=A0ABR0J8J4_9EURO|nr:Ark- serine/threonine protein kinase [Elasticomyces elasticus]KAK5029867.1 Ark- serine/threonine protein kinase [Exophiala sideris]KAK5031694.1 Ark- serine/threonine protein kinase [Exophiala sideris]KAK5058372.1 Ark- serine/threonine protein kinase [Exophiala sideris]KAK5180301.1 Ark- serine/threonine protein kinase [Eurotiomycetes sp. CCFEE 6388]
MAVYASQLGAKGPFATTAPPAVPTHAPPAGTFLPGTKVQVGGHRVIIDRYLSEGGFAHVYVVTLPRPVDGNTKAVLKRVAVPDKDHLASMRTEVETMKRLRGQKPIVKYIDSHASQLKGGGYEVFLLMEFCQGGGLIDFMNTRLQNRLTEPEILKIFTDVAEGVACMHYLRPPLMHRDIKVENVLIAGSGSSKIFKLCDFGSAAIARPAATTAAEGRLIEDDINRHTTLQYRSPEMIDVYRKQPIDEKSDIWALGVFLYKLCYYTTPFEEAGQMAILNARFKFPGYPRFSDELKLLIASMLREKPSDRPNIYQVLQKACKMDGRELPVEDIYARRTQSESRKFKALPPQPSSSQSRAGATLSPPKQEAAPVIPQIEPMRRGRPTNPVSHHGSAKPSPSPLRMMDSADPFAVLDGNKPSVEDELSHRFPTLDQFSLMTDKGQNFAFDPKTEKKADPLAQRVTNALADDAFARPPSPVEVNAVGEKAAAVADSQHVLEHKRSLESKKVQTRTNVPPVAATKTPMVSQGTMTSDSPEPTKTKPYAQRSVQQIPLADHPARSSSLNQNSSRMHKPDTSQSGSRLASLLRMDAYRSQLADDFEPRSPTSSRPSLEGGRPSARDLGSGVHRSQSLNMRDRPVSGNIGAGPTHIKDREIKPLDYETTFTSAEPEMPPLTHSESATNITSDVDFLKAREDEEKERKHHHKRLGSGSRHGKRASLPSMGIAGTTKLIAGKFGDAFKMFENNDSNHHRQRSDSPSGSPINVLTPIAGSEATDLSDDRQPFDETDDLSPEMRRELEKRKLEAEERRVANAAAEYRQRVAARGGGNAGQGKAASIQNRMQSLLGESDRPAQKTATGYGRYTASPVPQEGMSERPPGSPYQAPVNQHLHHSASAPTSVVDLSRTTSRTQRPMAPPKPKVLRSTVGDANSMRANQEIAVGGPVDEDWEANFSKKYPSLAGLEMVETSLTGTKSTTTVRTKEV